MTTYLRSSLVKEMLDSGVINYYNGEFLVWDVPSAIYPVNNIVLINAMKEKYPKISMAELNYQMGRMQSYRGNKVLVQRFGFEINEKLMKDCFGKSELLGMGTFEFIDFDAEKRTFTVMNLHNPYPHLYQKLFGMQKDTVCHYLRGLCAGSFQAFFEDEEMFCVEMCCTSKGDKACVFRIKPMNKWDKKNPVVKKQIIKNKLPKKVFEEYYVWDNLISKNAGKPKNEKERKLNEKRIMRLLEEFRRKKYEF